MKWASCGLAIQILMLGGQERRRVELQRRAGEGAGSTVDRRMNPEEDLEMEKARLISVLEQCQRDGIPLEWEEFSSKGPSGGIWGGRSGVGPGASCERCSGQRQRAAVSRCVRGSWRALILCGAGDAGVCVWAGVAFGRAWTEGIRGHAARSEMRSDLCVDGDENPK